MRSAVTVSLLLTVLGAAGGLIAGLVHRPAAVPPAEAAISNFPWPDVAEIGAPPVLEVSDPRSPVRTVTVVFTACEAESPLGRATAFSTLPFGTAYDAVNAEAARLDCRVAEEPFGEWARWVAPGPGGLQRMQVALRWRLEPLATPRP